MKLIKVIIILSFSFVASLNAEELSSSDSIWSKPLSADYRNIEFSYESVVKAIECLVEYQISSKVKADSQSDLCLATSLDRKNLKGREDQDRNAYQRNLIEGPPKEGPFTYLRLIRVGENKSMLQIESNLWNIILPTRRVYDIEEKRFNEIIENLKK